MKTKTLGVREIGTARGKSQLAWPCDLISVYLEVSGRNGVNSALLDTPGQYADMHEKRCRSQATVSERGEHAALDIHGHLDLRAGTCLRKHMG